MNLHRYDDALICYKHCKQALEIRKNASSDQSKDIDVVETLQNIGLCLQNLHQYDETLIHYKQALKIENNASPDQTKNSNVGATFHNIGFCLQTLYQYDEALIYSKQTKEIYENTSA